MTKYKNYFNKLYNKSQQEFNELMQYKLLKNEKMFIVTANPETYSFVKKNNIITKILNDDSVFIVPDGIGIIKAAKILDVKLEERIPGIEIAEELLRIANIYNKSIYFFGAKEEVLNSLKKEVETKYPNVKLAGMTNGYVKNIEDEYIKLIKYSPDIVLVALGIPAQEELIYKYLKDFKKGIFVGVGGSFDVLSGTKKRAPKLFQKLNIEWLYRIVKEPKRLKRFYNNNIKFILKIKEEKKKIKRN